MGWTVQCAEVKRYTEDEAGLAYLSVVLAERPVGRGRYIEFQVALDEDEAEEGYCVMDAPPPSYGGSIAALAMEVGTHKTLYGGVEECRLDKEVLTLRFSSSARKLFRWPRELRLRLDLPIGRLDVLRPALLEVFSIAPPGESAPRLLL